MTELEILTVGRGKRLREFGVAAGLLVLLTGLAACTSGGKRQPPSAVQAVEPLSEAADQPAAGEATADESEQLYAALDSIVADYEAGLELIGEGEAWLGEEKLDDAAGRILAAAAECAEKVSCEPRRFFDAYDRLLSLQSAALQLQRARLERVETDLPEESEHEAETSPFMGEMPELDRAASLLRGTDLRELITLNGPINAALDDWLTWLRPELLQAHQNYWFLRPKIAPIYQQAGLPEALLFAMIATESRGKVHAVSRAGAAGPLQFMRYTGHRYGLTEVDGFDLRFDPEAATRANVAYLNDLFRAFNNSLEKVLAAYNGGDGRMRSAQRRYGNVSFWDQRVFYSFPRETREYVPRLLAAAWLFLHPEDYNLEFPVLETKTTQLYLQQPISLGELAICFGQTGNANGWFRTLRNLNPRREPDERVPAGQAIEIPAQLAPLYAERCLGGELMQRAGALHEANYPEKPAMIRYTVRRGDTLNRIASRFPCAGLRQIAAINRIRPPRYLIREGQRLMIPTCR